MGKQPVEIDLGKNPCGCNAFFECGKLLVFKCKTHKYKPSLVTIKTYGKE